MSPLVLVAYNNAEILAQIEIALRDAGYRVMAVSDPMAAVEYLDHDHPAALVTRVDFGQGDLNGIALARMARFRYSKLPVLFVCTPAWDDLIKEIGDALRLPLDPAELVATVGRLIAGDSA